MAAAPRVLNVNVGIVGHVDAGKTALVAALSTQLSTAALDKNPQSKERGITLDLGFSSFQVPMPPHLAELPYDLLQFTLVDCPGHASLIRTIIGGVHIIDMMVLVIDVNKGLQAQAAECLVVGEITTSRMLVALNKVDMLPEKDRPKLIRKAAKKLASTFAMTKFAGVFMVPVAAKASNGPAEGEEGAATATLPTTTLGIDDLRSQLIEMVPADLKRTEGPFLFAVDHCFPIKGQGTVMTGTVLRGSVSANDAIELPALKIKKTVKSMQAFKRPVTKAVQGDRVGICVTQLDPTLLERGLAAAPGSIPTFTAAIASVEKIRFYAGKVGGKSKMHVSVGHTTVMAEIQVFGVPDSEGIPSEHAMESMIANLNRLSLGSSPIGFDMEQDYLHQDELYGLDGRPKTSSDGYDADDGSNKHFGPQWVVLKFDQPVTAPEDALVIGAKFDTDPHGEACRLAFYGRVVSLVDLSNDKEMQRLKVHKMKERQGQIERILPDGTSAVCKGFFKKESDITAFVGLKVVTGLGEQGVIESSFGKSGKFRVSFSHGIDASKGRTAEDNVLTLHFKRYIYDMDKKKIKQ